MKKKLPIMLLSGALLFTGCSYNNSVKYTKDGKTSNIEQTDSKDKNVKNLEKENKSLKEEIKNLTKDSIKDKKVEETTVLNLDDTFYLGDSKLTLPLKISDLESIDGVTVSEKEFDQLKQERGGNYVFDYQDSENNQVKIEAIAGNYSDSEIEYKDAVITSISISSESGNGNVAMNNQDFKLGLNYNDFIKNYELSNSKIETIVNDDETVVKINSQYPEVKDFNDVELYFTNNEEDRILTNIVLRVNPDDVDINNLPAMEETKDEDKSKDNNEKLDFNEAPEGTNLDEIDIESTKDENGELPEVTEVEEERKDVNDKGE